MAFSRATLNVELGASSIMWLVPPAGRHRCDRVTPCRNASGVARAVALTATQTSIKRSAQASCRARPHGTER